MERTLNIVLAVVVIMLGFGVMLTPNGIVIIVENPAVRYLVGAALVILGATAAFNQRAKARA